MHVFYNGIISIPRFCNGIISLCLAFIMVSSLCLAFTMVSSLCLGFTMVSDLYFWILQWYERRILQKATANYKKVKCSISKTPVFGLSRTIITEAGSMKNIAVRLLLIFTHHSNATSRCVSPTRKWTNRRQRGTRTRQSIIISHLSIPTRSQKASTHHDNFSPVHSITEQSLQPNNLIQQQLN